MQQVFDYVSRQSETVRCYESSVTVRISQLWVRLMNKKILHNGNFARVIWHVFDRGNERRAHIVSASSSRTRCPLANVGISAPLEQELDHLSVSLLAGHVQGCFTLAVNHVQYIRTLVEEKSGHLHAPFSSLASVERTHAVTVPIIDVGTVLEKYLD